MNGAHARTLNLALETVGTRERLATALSIPLQDLERYLAGEAALPHNVFLQALEIVSRGRYGRGKR
jgi:hypothetical protein